MFNISVHRNITYTWLCVNSVSNNQIIWFKAFWYSFSIWMTCWHQKNNEPKNNEPNGNLVYLPTFLSFNEHRNQTVLIDNSKIDTFVKQVTIEHMRTFVCNKKNKKRDDEWLKKIIIMVKTCVEKASFSHTQWCS